MKRRDIRFLLAILCFLQVWQTAAQEEEADTLSRWRWNAVAAVLWSRPFSNYPLSPQADENSVTKYKASDTSNHYLPGFLIGAEANFRPERSVIFLIGASISRTSAHYHSTYISETQTNRTGYTLLTKTTETEVKLKYTALNLQAGLRFRIARQVYCSGSFILNSPLRILRESDATVESLYSNNSGGSDRQSFSLHENEIKLKQKPANISFRLGFDYRFMTGDAPSSVFVFRNFGLLYALPWWGLGYSISLGS